ncbi:helix-hairpin-helix domain-containing protein [uncultured Aquitalea sp.]|uniref:ComEA family DNA-binding protein n=1 Tax=uncultured Aquitalea sp. TaxID=540272 RepID=UPI0025F45EA0|nr:helix-hairpin-helix domain-containing protein [uncultured Aquitalea sp.]
MKKLLAALLGFLFVCASAFAAVNINTATQEQLESLNGIGPVKAKAIIDYRAKNGAFKSVDDLKNVSGIGDKTLEKLRKDIAVSGATTAPAAAAKSGAPAAANKPAAAPAATAKPAAPAKPAKKDASKSVAKKP